MRLAVHATSDRRWLLAAVLALCTCSVDHSDNKHYVGEDSCPGKKNYKGFCVNESASVQNPKDSGSTNGGGSDDEDAGGSMASAGSGGAGGSTMHDITGQACEALEPMYCYLGPDESDMNGICRGGRRDCVNGSWGMCIGEVEPRQAEECNDLDDDCDGIVDEDVQLDDCCGGVSMCMGGHSVCMKTGSAKPETCNGKDDDCDGKVDEDADVPCIDGNAGCTEQGGVIVCTGVCRAGSRQCKDGTLSATCAGQTKPAASDPCNSDTQFGLDDDCDGTVDDDCGCTPNDTQPCYGGEANTAGKGICRAGTQTCGSDGKFGGTCSGEVRPGTEDCTNEGADDDCNGVKDDIPTRGNECTTTQTGACKFGTLQCEGGSLVCKGPTVMTETCNGKDDDCNGLIDDTFHLDSDPQNCGTCGHACGSAQTCCNGGCTDVNSDKLNCGTCNNRCGTASDCCDGRCVDPSMDAANCGACGNTCGTNEECCGAVCTNITTKDNCNGCGKQCTGLTTCCKTGSGYACGTINTLGLCL